MAQKTGQIAAAGGRGHGMHYRAGLFKKDGARFIVDGVSQTGDGIGGEGMVIKQGVGAVKPHIKGGLIGRYLFGQILRQGLEHLAAKNNMGIMSGHEVTSFILWIML